MGLLLLTSLQASPAHARDNAKVDAIGNGVTIETTAEVQLYNAPPSVGLTYKPGKKKELVPRGERMSVSETRVVKTLIGKETWLKLSRAGRIRGWAYAGKAGGVSCCFKSADSGGGY